MDDHRQWVFLRMHAAYFLLNAKPSDVRLSATGTPEEALVLEWCASKGARLSTPCLCSARRWNLSLLYPKVEHFFALPESGTRTQNRPDVPRTPEGEPGLSGREPDAGSPALDQLVFPKESLLVSSNLTRDNRSVRALHPPEGVCRKPTKPLYAFSRKRDCSQPFVLLRHAADRWFEPDSPGPKSWRT